MKHYEPGKPYPRKRTDSGPAVRRHSAAAYARRAGEQLVLTGLWSPREGVLLQETQQAPLCEAEQLGRRLAESLRQKR